MKQNPNLLASFNFKDEAKLVSNEELFENIQKLIDFQDPIHGGGF